MTRIEPAEFLTRIVGAKRKRVADAEMRVPEAIVRKMAAMAPDRPSFRSALAAPGRTRIIAEVKKASPSAGVLVEDLDAGALARCYAEAGASAISVVTEEDFFQGDLGWVKAAAEASSLPVLRKDFVFSEYQVWETRAAGASAILLIAAMLDAGDLERLIEAASSARLDALVEVHDAGELQSAVAAGATMIGVNNRDLKTFEVRLETTLELADRMPAGAVFVTESGIRTREDRLRLAEAGADAFLIGEQLLRSSDPAQALRGLL